MVTHYIGGRLIVPIVTALPHILGRLMEKSQEFLNPRSTNTYLIVGINNLHEDLKSVDDSNRNQKDDDYDTEKNIFNENYGRTTLKINKEKFLLDNYKNTNLEIYNNDKENFDTDKGTVLNEEMFNKLKIYEAKKDEDQSISEDTNYDEEQFTDNDMADGSKDDELKDVNINYYDVDLTRAEKGLDLNTIQKSILRDNSSNNKKQEQFLRKTKKKHLERIRKLHEFMQERPDSTQYFYDEMERILQQRTVKDDLRIMITYLGKKENLEIKNKVINCYIKARQDKLRLPDIYDHPTNNLVIHYLKDPDNDNV